LQNKKPATQRAATVLNVKAVTGQRGLVAIFRQFSGFDFFSAPKQNPSPPTCGYRTPLDIWQCICVFDKIALKQLQLAS
jgi:hypothetical protein